MKVPVLSSLILFHARQAGGGYHSLLPSGGGPRTHTGAKLNVLLEVTQRLYLSSKPETDSARAKNLKKDYLTYFSVILLYQKKVEHSSEVDN